MTADKFSPHMEVTARHLWGDPNASLSSATQLRWGTHGSRSVDLDKGVWFDNEAGEGGGVLDLVCRETGCKNGMAVDYLRSAVGVVIEDDRGGFQAAQAPTQQRRIAATYDYADEAGELIFQVVRFEPKDFRQRRPDKGAADGWNWSVKGTRQVPYRLPEMLEATASGGTVFIVEGEKDADALWLKGIPATCNAGGAGKWPEGLAEHFLGVDVVILPDNDEAGRNHAAIVGKALLDIAKSIRVVTLPGLPIKGDTSDWMKAGGDPSMLYALAEQAGQPWRPMAPESRFGAVLWSAIDTIKTRRDFLIEDMLFCGDSALIYGASQSGKSFLAVDLGLAIARGEPFLGKAVTQGAVIYQAGEGGLGLLSRLKAYRQHHGLERADLPFVLLPRKVDLFSREGDAEALLEEVLAFKAWLADPLVLVVIDTFATASLGANENASEDMSRVLDAGRKIQEAAACAVLWVHHKNASGEKPRGHTSIYANADTALEVIRDDDNPRERTLRVAKVKDGEDGEKIGFELQRVEIGAYESGKLITSCVVVPAEVGSARAGKDRRYLANGQAIFLKCLDDAILHRGGIVPPIEGVPHAIQGVQWHDFLPIYRAVRSVTHDDNAIRQALHRDGDALSAKGLIGKSSPYVWITDRGREYLR